MKKCIKNTVDGTRDRELVMVRKKEYVCKTEKVENKQKLDENYERSCSKAKSALMMEKVLRENFKTNY